MSAAQILDVASLVGLGVLMLALLLTVVRIIRGPSLADRILGLDLITTLVIAIIALIAVRTDFALYVDIAIAMGLVGFLSTVALSRYLLRQAELRKTRPETGE